MDFRHAKLYKTLASLTSAGDSVVVLFGVWLVPALCVVAFPLPPAIVLVVPPPVDATSSIHDTASSSP